MIGNTLVPISNGSFVLFACDDRQLPYDFLSFLVGRFVHDGPETARAYFDEHTKVFKVEHAMPKTFRATGHPKPLYREFVMAAAGSAGEIQAVRSRFIREIEAAGADLDGVREAVDIAYGQAYGLERTFGDLFAKRITACSPKFRWPPEFNFPPADYPTRSK